jgi:hypothetical protein
LLRLLSFAVILCWSAMELRAAPPTTEVSGDTAMFPPVAGHTVTFEPTVYDASNLWMFIDGAAELFLAYGFVDLHVAYYRASSGEEIRAEIYRHDNRENAFGMYSQERSPDCAFIKIGVQGYAEEGGLNFLSGCCYVKLSANSPDSTSQLSIMLVARAIEAMLGDPGSWPTPLALLPTEGRVQNSEQYISESYLGYKFLRGAYRAKYGTPVDAEIFVIPAESEAGAESLASALAGENHVSPTSDVVRTIPDAHQGDITLVIHGRHVAGIVRCKNATDRSKFVKFLQSSLQ